MNNTIIHKVFVSSTYEDLKEERHEVLKSLLNLDCIPIGMEIFPAANDSAWKFITRQIDDCDYYILIVAGRYGTESSDGISFTEKEYQYAQQQGIPTVVFVFNDINKIPKEKTDDDLAKLNLFISKIQKRLIKKWCDKNDLAKEVTVSLVTLRKDFPSIGWIRGDSYTDDHAKLLKTNHATDEENKSLTEQLTQSNVRIDSIPQVSINFERTIPKLMEILENSLKEPREQTEVLKIRVLGVCFHKSFECLKGFIENSCSSGKRIEIRLSKLYRDSDTWSVLDDRWNDYHSIFLSFYEEFKNRVNEIENANVSVKVTKYSHMPNWHGISINQSHLFLSSCLWNSENKMTAGENPYIHYIRGKSSLHDQKILQFRRWFDYGRYHNVKAEFNMDFDTKI